MDHRTEQRITVITHVLAGELTLGEAARYLDRSTRQVRRLVQAVAAEGPLALVHGNAGRTPANRIDTAVERRVLALARSTYAGFNPVHLAEALAEDEGLIVSARTVRRILARAGIAPARTRRAAPRRVRRARMPRAGMLLQTDGSDHAWLEDRGPRLTLIAGVDDATSRLSSGVFRAAEDAAGYFTMLLQTAITLGLPEALYTDRHGIFIKDPNRPPTLTEQLTGRRSLTQVGRALEVLGIRWIGARSAQGKGRVERTWGTLQDRLVAELRRAHVDTLEGANALLAWYVPRHNARFGVPAADAASAWRPWPLALPPEAVFCFEYSRRLERDATISWDGRTLLVPPLPVSGSADHGRRIVVQERLDGSLWVRQGEAVAPLAPAPDGTPRLRARPFPRVTDLQAAPEPDHGPDEPRPPSAATVWRPAADHPWRRGPITRSR